MDSSLPPSPAISLDERIAATRSRVRAFLRRIAPDDAEDLTQEAMARALRYRDAYRPEGSLRSWMLRIAFRVVLDHRERERRQPLGLGDGDVEIEDPRSRRRADANVAADREAIVASRLDALGDAERRAFVRFHRDGRSIREIATELAMPEGTVKSHLHRARRKLATRPREEDD